MIKQQFIDRVIGILESENDSNEKQYNIPFIIAPLVQRLNECEEFLKDLQDHDYYINVLDIDDEDCYTNAELQIGFYDNTDGDDYLNYLNFSYTINFRIDERMLGYCQCIEDDKDYDVRYKCCGHGCDWYAPSFSIIKHYSYGNYSWNGDEHDYWDFQDKFNNVTLKEKEDLQKKTQIKSLEEQIKDLTEKLHKLQG